MTPSSETKLDTISFLIELPSFVRPEGPVSAAPFGEATDCVVRPWSAASHHLEAMQHLREHIEPDFDTGLRGPLGERCVHSVAGTRKQSCMASGELSERCWRNTE